ncbi:MAG: ATP-binding protein [Desulfovibrionaceae bacterium]
MDQQHRLSILEQQVKRLQAEKAAALEALSIACALGSVPNTPGREPDATRLPQSICDKVGQMVPLRAAGMYLVDDATQDFSLAFATPPDQAAHLEREARGLMADQSFAYALQTQEPTFFLDAQRQEHILLHVLATPSRIRGMFVGILAGDKETLLDAQLKLLSVVMLAAAHALENAEVHAYMRDNNLALERQVARRTQELTSANELLLATLTGMQAGVLLIDAETNAIVNINPAGLRMLGASKEEVVGKRCFNFVCPNAEGNCPILNKGLDVDNSERILLDAAGREVPIQKTVSRVTINGRPHLVESFIDITQQKKLAALKEDIDRMMRHDLKTPLNGLIGLPDVLLMDPSLSDTQREFLGYIKASGRKLLRMINMSLDLYKMETGVYDYAPEPNDVAAILRNVRHDLADRLTGKGLGVMTYLNGSLLDDDATVSILCEELLLYSLLSNLVLNALEASPAGETIRVTMRRDSDTFTMAIHNLGAIPEAIRPTFFDKYATAGKSGGTGLGTYSAKLIVETMGGAIAFTTSEDDGTTLTFSIPQAVVRTAG